MKQKKEMYKGYPNVHSESSSEGGIYSIDTLERAAISRVYGLDDGAKVQQKDHLTKYLDEKIAKLIMHLLHS